MNELRSRAIRLLARREHTRAELAGKLATHGTQEAIETVLADLERSGLLSDARAASAYVRGHAARFGAARLRQTLRTKGVESALIEQQVAELPAEIERAREVWTRKFGSAPGDAREWARQARFLQSRGFSSDVIRRLLKDTAEPAA
ncbi:MAG: recombination regulator RecX [Gammaproteobacteria bacterium]|nr:recombination regulator RecX [Gammaproteobacteria bacterium]MBU1645630.1 recombination regulator RecX [Gammaproteobacteria bacterium]MBU1973568.1 recombination regulator RecX [Gammaproteobacteria bacterium]